MNDLNSTVRHVPIQGFFGYFVGDDGSIWSQRNRGPIAGVLRKRAYKRKLKKMDNGYLSISLIPKPNERPVTLLVHRIVLLAFIGPCPAGMECCHDDGNRTNNKITNLRWGTKKSNAADRVKHGTNNHAERKHLKKRDVVEIKKLLQIGNISKKEIANRYKTKILAVQRIANGTSWKNLR